MSDRITEREARSNRENGKAFDAFLGMVSRGFSQTKALEELKHPSSTLRGWIQKDPERMMVLEAAKALGRLAKLEPLQELAEARAKDILKLMDPGAPTPAQMTLLLSLLKSRHIELKDGPQVAVGVKVESKKPEEKVITLQAAEKEVQANGSSEQT